MNPNNTAAREVELKANSLGERRILKDTIAVYRCACKYISDVVFENWDDISRITDSQKRLGTVEALIHQTKDNPSPHYKDFDVKFYKFPSYYRRSAVNFVLGEVSSYMTRLEQWEEELHEANAHGKKFSKGRPVFNCESTAFPCLYNMQSYKFEGCSGNQIFIKVFIRNTWDWVKLDTDHRDWDTFNRYIGVLKKCHNPFLQFKNNKFYLVFPLEFKAQKFPKIKLSKQKVLGIDLGLNHGAVCSVVDFNGNVYARYFDPFADKRARIEHMLCVIKELQRKSGRDQSLASAYQKLDGFKKDYARQLSHWIVKIAQENGVYGIVFEHLNQMKGRGKLKMRLHHWVKNTVREMSKAMAFRIGIRTFTINPKNTSALAYDGSGKVKRDKDNYSLCTFASGKRYHADLSASYNIAARYFVRQMEREFSSDTASELWEQLKAEVPELAKRTDCTLSTLWKASSIVNSQCQKKRTGQDAA